MRRVACAAVIALVAGACAGGSSSRSATSPSTTRRPSSATTTTTTRAGIDDGGNVYAHTTKASDVSPVLAGVPTRVYVPNSQSNTVDVIDPSTYRVVAHFAVGRLPQHVTPAWDLKTLYVDNDEGNSLTPIDPRTATPGTPIPVEDPYNLYFTPDGTKAIVVAERLKRLDVRDPHTWKLLASIAIPHAGVDHADFSADGTTMVLSCEFSGYLVRVDLATLKVTGELDVGGQPVDVKLSPDGTKYYVAQQRQGGVMVIDAKTFRQTRFIPTGAGTHGLYPSRDATRLYASNRNAGTVSVLDFHTGDVLATWRTGGSPDMGGVTADGRELWLSGRYDAVVYVVDTTTGTVTHRIPVGRGPHGLAVFPQPGRYSLGHTGNFR